MTENDPFEVLDSLEFEHTRGKKTAVIGRVGFTLQFFLPYDGQWSIPAKLAEAESYVRSLIPLEVYRWSKIIGGEWPTAEISADSPPTSLVLLSAYLATHKEAKPFGAFGLSLSSGSRNGVEAPSHFFRSYYQGRDDFFFGKEPEDPNYDPGFPSASFQISFSLPWLAARDEPLFPQQLFMKLCDILKPRHAQAGLHMSASLLIEWLDQGGAETFYPFLKKHPGLISGHALDAGMAMGDLMGPINWLTAIDEELVERCGGRDIIRNHFTLDGIDNADFDGGLIVKAGAAPQMGDMENGVLIPYYGEVARALKPARIQEFGNYQVAPAYYIPGTWLGMDYDMNLRTKAQHEYLNRFDEM